MFQVFVYRKSGKLAYITQPKSERNAIVQAKNWEHLGWIAKIRKVEGRASVLTKSERVLAGGKCMNCWRIAFTTNVMRPQL